MTTEIPLLVQDEQQEQQDLDRFERWLREQGFDDILFLGGSFPFQLEAINRELGIACYFRARGSTAGIELYEHNDRLNDFDERGLINMSLDRTPLYIDFLCGWEDLYAAGAIGSNEANYAFWVLWSNAKGVIK